MSGTQTHTQTFKHKVDDRAVTGLDFSPSNSSRLVSASGNRTASIWDIGSRKEVRTLCHDNWVYAAQYSPQGDRIATATVDSVRVYDSSDGTLLVHIAVTFTPCSDSGLLWSQNHLLVISDRTIKQFEASSGSLVSQWSVPDTDELSCIALPKHREYIIYSTNCTVSFLDTATHAQLGPIQHSGDVYSIAVSPHSLIAIGGEEGKITAYRLSNVSSVSCSILPSVVVYHVFTSFKHAGFSGTRHSDWYCCPRSLEACTTSDRELIIDHSRPQVLGLEEACTR